MFHQRFYFIDLSWYKFVFVPLPERGLWKFFNRPYVVNRPLPGTPPPPVDLLLCRLPTPINLTVQRRAVRREMRAKVAILLTVAFGAPPSISVAGDPIPATTTPYAVESNATDPYRNHRRDSRRHELKFSARRLARPIPADRRPINRHCHQRCECRGQLYPHVPSNWPLTTIVVAGDRRLSGRIPVGRRRPPCRKFKPAYCWRSGAQA